MIEILDYILGDFWHFLGVAVLMFIPATWRLINVDVTLWTVKPTDLKTQEDDNE